MFCLIRSFMWLVKILAGNVTMALIRENSDSRKTGSLNICSHWCLYQMQEYFPIVLPTYIKWQVYFSIVHTLINDKCIFSFIFLGKNQRSNKIYWIIDINTISHLLQSCKLRNEELMTWNDEVVISGTYLYICLTKISKWPFLGTSTALKLETTISRLAWPLGWRWL